MKSYFLLLITIYSCLFINLNAKQAPFDIRYHLGTKTPYYKQQSTPLTPPPAHCRPVHFALVARHGTRNPTAKDFVKFDSLSATMSQNAKYITNPEFAWMKSWKSPISIREAGELVKKGEEEHYALGQRFKGLFPSLLALPYSPSDFFLQSTQVSRAGQSGSSFTYGLFQDDGNLGKESFQPTYFLTTSFNQDIKLRFFDQCSLYQSQVKENDTATQQADIYSAQQFPQVAEKIAKTIGAYPYWKISTKDVGLMWKACGFELAITGQRNQFCKLFDEQTNAILEYENDLKKYWEASYGHGINYEMACPLLKDIFNFFDAHLVGNVSYKSSLRFAHAETVIPFLALLGLYKDVTPLMANSPPSFIMNRKFRTSQQSTFAANVAMVLYDCSTPASPSSFSVKLLVNEKEMEFPGCNSLYCPLETLRELYSDALSCKFCKMCQSNGQCFCEAS